MKAYKKQDDRLLKKLPLSERRLQERLRKLISADAETLANA